MPLRKDQIVQAGSANLVRSEDTTLLDIHQWVAAFGTAIRIFDGLYTGGFRSKIRYSVAIKPGENMDELRAYLYSVPAKYVFENNGTRIFEMKEKGFVVGYVVYVVLPD